MTPTQESADRRGFAAEMQTVAFLSESGSEAHLQPYGAPFDVLQEREYVILVVEVKDISEKNQKQIRTTKHTRQYKEAHRRGLQLKMRKPVVLVTVCVNHGKMRWRPGFGGYRWESMSDDMEALL